MQPFLKEGATIGHASSTEIGQAAFTMLQACVVERGMGGMALNIGKCQNGQAATRLATQSLRYLKYEGARESNIWVLNIFSKMPKSVHFRRGQQGQCCHLRVQAKCQMRPDSDPRTSVGLMRGHICKHESEPSGSPVRTQGRPGR